MGLVKSGGHEQGQDLSVTVTNMSSRRHCDALIHEGYSEEGHVHEGYIHEGPIREAYLREYSDLEAYLRGPFAQPVLSTHSYV